MDLDALVAAAMADADRRGLPALKPLLEPMARSTRALRAADWRDHADGQPPDSGRHGSGR